MADNDHDLLTTIASDVRYLRSGFDEHKAAFKEHVAEDKKVQQDFLRPLWEESQRNQGAFRATKWGGMALWAVIVTGINWLIGGGHRP